MSEQKTVDPVSQSYDIGSLLTVCIDTLWAAQNNTGNSQETNERIGAVQATLEVVKDKWGDCHDALELAEKASASEGKP